MTFWISPRLKPAKLEVETIKLLLPTCWNDTMRGLSLRAHQKGLELACHVLPGVPDALQGDPNRLARSWSTWWETPSSSPPLVKFWCALPRSPESEGTRRPLYFSVADTGIGVPRKNAAHF